MNFDFIQRSWTQIQAHIGDWSFTTKWLIGSLVVILLLVGVIFVNLASTPQMVPISTVAEGGAVELVAHLEADGIENEVRGSQVYVRTKDQGRAIATLANHNLISPNAYAAFEDLVSNQSWMTTNRQSDQQMRMATGKFLGTVVGEFPGVDHAYVVIDKPDTVGIGLGYVPPSAMVTVSMQPGQEVNRRMADALISLLTGSVSGLPAENVKVIDATNRREFGSRDENSVDAGTHLEHLMAQERLHKEKVEEVLRSFSGAMVAVKIVTSQVVRRSDEYTGYDKPAVASEQTSEQTMSNMQAGGEAGSRSNTGASIDTGGGVGTSSSTTENETTFHEPQVIRRTQEQVAGNEIRLINVSVAIPRSYFVQIYMAQQGGSESVEPPSDAELEPIIEAEKSKIKDLVEPQLVAMPTESGPEGGASASQPGTISVAMVYDRAFLEPVMAGSSGGLGAVIDSEWAPMAMVGSLAVISLVFMLGMVKKATRTESMPTIEELAGVPPTLPTDDDLMGEVDEMDGGLAGVEVAEEDLRSRQIAEQISELVKANPEEVSNLLGKWVETEKL